MQVKLTLHIQNEPTGEPVNEPVSEPVNEPVSEPVNGPVSEPVNERQQAILSAMKQNPSITREERIHYLQWE